MSSLFRLDSRLFRFVSRLRLDTCDVAAALAEVEQCRNRHQALLQVILPAQMPYNVGSM